MFVLTNNVSATYRVIATFVGTAVVMATIGFYATAQAANVTDVSDTLSDSASASVSDHTIDFITPSGIATGETVEVTFPVGFNLTGVTAGDIDIEVNSVNDDADWTPVIAGQVITLTQNTGTVAAGDQVTIKIGTNATGGTNQITNPTPTGGNESFQIDIAGTMADSGHTRVVILDTTLVTAKVDTIFNFTVLPVGVGVDVNGETTTIGSSSTTIPFGTLTSGTPQVIAQDLTVESNAINGFVVTVETDQSLLSSTGADIDNFKEDVIAAPQAWAAPSANIADEKTWGHWGLTSEDSDLNGDEFGNNLWAGVTSTPRQVFSHTGPADASTPDIGSTTVGYKVEISALQEAGDDYSTTLTYIATPTF